MLVDTWIDSLTTEEREKWYKFVADDLMNGGKIFGTKIVKTIEFKNIFSEIKESGDYASQGKCLVKI